MEYTDPLPSISIVLDKVEKLEFSVNNKGMLEPLQRLQTGQALLAGSPMGGISGGTGSSAYQRGVYQQPTALGQAVGAVGTLLTGIGAFKSDIDLK